MKNCCKSNNKTKKCRRNKDNKIFNLPRRFSKKHCLTKKIKGFSMKSSCAPFKFCKIKKQNGGNNGDCINNEDPVTLEEINDIPVDNLIKFKVREPITKINNCYDKESIKRHIESSRSRGISLNNIKDPLSNKVLGEEFIRTNFPEVLENIEDEDEYEYSEEGEEILNIELELEIIKDEWLENINSEEDDNESTRLIEEFSDYLNNTIQNIPENIREEFLFLLYELVEANINSPNKKRELENILETQERDLVGGAKKKRFLYNPNNPKKSFDVYIDKNPKDTIPIKYTTVKDVEATIKKLERLYKQGKYSHKRIWLVGMIMKVRLEAIKKHKKEKYPNAKNVTKRYNLSKRYFKFLGKRSKTQKNKRKKMNFKPL